MKTTANIVGYIAAFLTITCTIFKMNHLAGAGLMLLLCEGFLTIYFPVYLVNRMADVNRGQSLVMHYFLAIAVGLFQLAIAFKIEHWPGAGFLLIAGCGLFTLLYLPLLLRHKIKQNPPGNFKIIYISGFVGALLLPLGIVLKILHWPGSLELMILGGGVLGLLYFPLYLFNFSKNVEDTYIYLRDVFFALIIGGILSIYITADIFSTSAGNASDLNCSIAADRMNVLYIGVDNPLSISVTDFHKDKIMATEYKDEIITSISEGTLEGAKGKFTAHVTKQGPVSLRVSTVRNHKDTVLIGDFMFRVKRIPDPVTYLGPYFGSTKIKVDELKTLEEVSSKIQNFDFDMSFEIVSFSLAVRFEEEHGPIHVVETKGNKFNPEMKTLIERCKPTDKIYIESVVSKDPTGVLRKIPGINLQVE